MSKHIPPVDSPIITNIPAIDRRNLKLILLLSDTKAQDIADDLKIHKQAVSGFVNRKINNSKILSRFEELARNIEFNIDGLQVNCNSAVDI